MTLGIKNMENSPTIIGKDGVPFDMYGGKSYQDNSGSKKCANVNGAPDSFSPQALVHCEVLACAIGVGTFVGD